MNKVSAPFAAVPPSALPDGLPIAPSHVVERVPSRAAMTLSAAAWGRVEPAHVSHFHASSSGHRPRTEVRLVYDASGISAHFSVRDQFVRFRHTEYQSLVSEDSCVELFLQPCGDKGYFNFEMNCGGTLLLYYIEDPTRVPGRLFKKFVPVPEAIAQEVVIEHALSRVLDEEIQTPVDWSLCCHVPFRLFEPFIGPVEPVPDDRWAGNLFKCSSQSSHPHWAAWSPIGEQLRFHQPQHFGTFVFG